LPLAKTQVVEQQKTRFADKTDSLGDAGEKRRERRFPGPRHDSAVP
jgi:hypothetical protein